MVYTVNGRTPYEGYGAVPTGGSLTSRRLPLHGFNQWQVTTPPAIEPLTITSNDQYDVKWFGSIDGNRKDGMLNGFIQAARENAELYLGRALISQTITMAMDYWPSDVIELPNAAPLLSVTKVVTLDEDDTETVYSSGNYYLDTLAEPGKLIIKRGVTEPINTSRDHGGYQIVYVAGYGTSREDIPQNIIEGLKLWVMDAHENKIISTDPPPSAETFLRRSRVQVNGRI
jgi:uncharacterized phiE125 gp8 family phage protein